MFEAKETNLLITGNGYTSPTLVTYSGFRVLWINLFDYSVATFTRGGWRMAILNSDHTCFSI